MEFWDDEYANELSEPFDWLLEPEELPISIRGRVLVIGCGHSRLSAFLAQHCDVVSIDSSARVIEKMRAAHPQLRWEVADARRLPFKEEFDYVVDKACMDAILCYDGVERVVSEARRVLKDGGRMVVLACKRGEGDIDGCGGGEPLCLAAFEGWQVETRELEAKRGMAPQFADIRPKSYALIVATKIEALADYYEYYGENPTPHEAFVSWNVLEPWLKKYVKGRVLEVGFGNSDIGNRLAEFTEYVGIDAVPSAVREQKRRYPHLDLRRADARSFTSAIAPGSIDVVFDKGTADALFLYPGHAIDEYIASLNELQAHRFVVVACARTDSILNGHGPPKLPTVLSWSLTAHHILESDVGAGPRTFDLLVFDKKGLI